MFHVEQYGKAVAKALADYVQVANLSLSDEQARQFSLYATELAIWNDKINLTAVTDATEVAVKHYLDSIYGSNVLTRNNKDFNVLDVGSGGGFPGIPLKIMHPDMCLYLIEKNNKKCSFLSHLVGKLRLTNVHVVNRSLEEVSADPNRPWKAKFQNIVIRAMKIRESFQAIAVMLGQGGRFILYRTRPLQEVEEVNLPPSLKILKNLAYSLPHDYGQRMIVVLEKVGSDVPRGTVL